MTSGKDTKREIEKIVENDKHDSVYSSYEPTTNELVDSNPPGGGGDPDSSSESESEQGSE